VAQTVCDALLIRAFPRVLLHRFTGREAVGRTHDNLFDVREGLAAASAQFRLPPCVARPFLTVVMYRGGVTFVAVGGHQGYAADGRRAPARPQVGKSDRTATPRIFAKQPLFGRFGDRAPRSESNFLKGLAVNPCGI
jgi:hypothetical protein